MARPVTPRQFIQKWSASSLKERSGAQEHFLDLCRLLGEQTPAEADPEGSWYTFERGAKKTGGGDGWADVWKRGCFAWEYKGKHANLTAAYAQLQRYATALENPPLLIVSDMETVVVHTNFTNTVQQTHTIQLEREERRRLLTWAFREPEQLRPGTTREALTREVAGEFAGLAQRLRERGHEPLTVAHFITKLVFCLFAEDIGVLPERLFTKLLDYGRQAPTRFVQMASSLFRAMRTGEPFGVDPIDWFNGGLFDDDVVLALERPDLDELVRTAKRDWSSIEPSIFGTLFERGLDPGKRSQLGAHYTDRGSIERIVGPVVLEPLAAEWERERTRIAGVMDRAREAKEQAAAILAQAAALPAEAADLRAAKRAAGKLTAGLPKLRAAEGKALAEAKELFAAFRERLASTRVLDPACGSGNFLYVALQGLHDLEWRAMREAEALGLAVTLDLQVDARCVLGIEVNAYAAELARVTVWIGEIQWRLQHGFDLNRNPVLQSLEQIECRDALLNGDGSEATWPAAECVVGNPPFLGDKKMLGELGEGYVGRLRERYRGRVPGGADLVTYWFEKGRAAIEEGRTRRVGLVATNSIRGGQNRKVLERVRETGVMFNAWSDEPWVVEGAAVRVSLVCFGGRVSERSSWLDGRSVDEILPDLRGTSQNDVSCYLAEAKPLSENRGFAIVGTQKNGAFDVSEDVARKWLLLPTNPNGRPNTDVVRPWSNGIDVTRRSSNRWVIDFGTNMSANDAAHYEAPFRHVETNVYGARQALRREAYVRLWWLHAEPRASLRKATSNLRRFIVTPRVAKHRLFVWMDRSVLPDCQLVAIAREDDTTFGILHSRFHEAWALRLGTSLEDRPRYTPTTTFETFPFPEGLTPNLPASSYADDPRARAIAEAAARLNELRERWLNPPECVQRVPEVVPGFPDRLVPVDDRAAEELKKRTLTALYNQKPTWLRQAHAELDRAVAAAYGWPEEISEEEALRELLRMNWERAGESRRPA